MKAVLNNYKDKVAMLETEKNHWSQINEMYKKDLEDKEMMLLT